MNSGCDYIPTNYMFVYFLTLPSLLHPSIFIHTCIRWRLAFTVFMTLHKINVYSFLRRVCTLRRGCVLELWRSKSPGCGPADQDLDPTTTTKWYEQLICRDIKCSKTIYFHMLLTIQCMCLVMHVQCICRLLAVKMVQLLSTR